ncbi:MAG: VWA domain-containing protein [Gammaproteobacteria bacterium]|nr:VWA domain-containing protein [Gammaproteobacteria bacterium]MXY55168.1 VWA domain-containing protein [Gammaproteobacteria bacterium]MYF31540.1 VWA domain-containing protein [Gammaproteobacteria bacterium]MYK47057.1 VWA domain-containing protein [Gammaproteobacteria bacterium]
MANASGRRFNVFSLSFLDVMSCGFGAVVLVFLIINHRIDDEAKDVDPELLSESRFLDIQILTGEKNLVDLQQLLEDRRKRVAEANRELLALIEDRDRRLEDLEELDARTAAERESVEELTSDVESREQDVKRLQEEEQLLAGNRLREIKGEGDRQYLTGLYVGGTHILIALDASASMLDETIVQVIRRRNMSRQRQLTAPKWVRARKTVDWLAAQIPLDSNFQTVVYGDEARFVLPETAWIPVTEAAALHDTFERLGEIVPAGGTNLEGLFELIGEMRPLPDNVFLVTDGLPTRSNRKPRSSTVDGRQRVRLFNDAARLWPTGVPVNVIMFPMEGDWKASAAYWYLAARSGGTYMSPSRDWP